MWYEKLKDEKILIHQGSEHNKFWTGQLHESTCSVVTRWGRIGTKGQTKTKSFGSVYQAANFLDTKFREKRRKGYTDKLNGESIDPANLDKLAVEAAVVGTQNKCHNMQWVEIISGDSPDVRFKSIPDERLYDPECVPGLLVAMETRKEYDGLTRFGILFTGEAAYKAKRTGTTSNWSNQEKVTKIAESDELYKLTKKVEEAVGRSLG